MGRVAARGSPHLSLVFLLLKPLLTQKKRKRCLGSFAAVLNWVYGWLRVAARDGYVAGQGVLYEGFVAV